MYKIEFTKMVASGNDFVITEHRGQSTENRNLGELAKRICDRRYGVGADGLLVLEQSKKADIKMRIFNPDGSEADMCGNGARCCVKYYDYQLASTSGQIIKIQTKAGILEASVSGDMVRLKLSKPYNLRLNTELTTDDGRRTTVCCINTGVPHAVIFVDDLENIDVDKLGRAIRNSKEFAPEGANVDFVKIINEDTIAIRTYERGVEAETLACGTGAVASAIISGRHNVVTQGKEVLKVYFDKKDGKISNVWLEGSVKIVYSGRMEL